MRGLFEGVLIGASIGFAFTNPNDVNAGTRQVAGLVLGAAAGLTLPLALNRGNKEVRTGDVVFVNTGQNWGYAHGLLLPMLFQLSANHSLTNTDRRIDFGLAAGLSLAAGGLAAYGASSLNFSPGQAASIDAAGRWGAVSGLLIVDMLAPKDLTHHWAQAAIAAGLALADGAILMTWANRSTFDVDRSRVTLMNIGGVAGMAVGIAAAYFIDPSLTNHRVIAGALLVGAAGGLGAGYYLSDGWDEYKKSVPPSNGSGLSLLELRDGQWSVGMPLPRPVAQVDRGGTRVRPVLSIAEGRF